MKIAINEILIEGVVNNKICRHALVEKVIYTMNLTILLRMREI